MKCINRIIDLILYSSLFTACCATGLCMATERLVGSAIPPLFSHLHSLVLGSSLVVYNIPKIIVKPGLKKMKLSRLWYCLFFFAGLVMMLTGLWPMPAKVVILTVILGAFAFTYSLPLLPFQNKKRLREFGWLKIMVLTGVWTIATSILPIICLNKHITDYPFEVLLRFVFIFTLCVVFDIRDMQADQQNNIKTLPHKVGIQNSYRLINIALLFFLVLSMMQFYKYHHIERLAGALLTSIVTWMVVHYLNKHPSEKAYILLADGVMLLYAILVLIPNT